jgi:endonuclease G
MTVRKYLACGFALLGFAGALYGEDNLKFGQPACAQPLLDKKFFVVCHDPNLKVPLWVGYALTREELSGSGVNRKGIDFHADPDLPKGSRAELADYSKSGYDKGHMAPAADFKRTRDAIKATFTLSNAVPQRHGVNAGAWGHLEDAVRALADSRGQVWVFSGPVFAGKRPMGTIGPDKVAIPTHTFKVVLAIAPDGTKEMFAYVMPNLEKTRTALRDFSMTVRYVEKLTGMDFFGGLTRDEQDALEMTLKELPGN